MGFVTDPCRFKYTLPQCTQADGRLSGESLTCGSVNLTLDIGRASWSGQVVPLPDFTKIPCLFHSHRLWDGYGAVAAGCGLGAEPALSLVLSLPNGSSPATFRAMRVTNLNNLVHKK